ncbi:MAG: hypothetical protein GY705_22565 [Bacteroidetes bacterium]|nr:hypothetical protein [Bacteroidota bacterium]
MLKNVFSISLLVFASLMSFAQDIEMKNTSNKKTINVFLDCNACDINYLRQNVNYINYVRDPEMADIHILVTQQYTGANTRKYVFDFIGKGGFELASHSITFADPPNASSLQRKETISEKFELGLIPFWLQTQLADKLDVKIKPEKGETVIKEEKDPWNNWVFEVGAGGSLNLESTKSAFNIWNRNQANKITENWKTRTRTYLSYREKRFETDDDNDIISSSHFNYISTSTVKSINDHWSVGAFAFIHSSTYRNMDLGASIAPAIEFSIFPYEEVNRKEITIAYRLNYNYRDYIEKTIFDKLDETLWDQEVEISARIHQPWGSFFAGIQGSHFLHDFNQNNIEIESEISFRVLKGLSLFAEGLLEWINDQRSLPAGDISLEDLLLAQRQVATNYRIEGSVGVKYTFGSIYNNVVNTRL